MALARRLGWLFAPCGHLGWVEYLPGCLARGDAAWKSIKK